MIPKVAQNMITKLEVLNAYVQRQQDKRKIEKRVLWRCDIGMTMPE